jgi:hypothetical protein
MLEIKEQTFTQKELVDLNYITRIFFALSLDGKAFEEQKNNFLIFLKDLNNQPELDNEKIKSEINQRLSNLQGIAVRRLK